MTDINQLDKDLKSGRISRRDFVKLSAMFGLTAAAPGILLAGSHGGPKKGGHLKLAIGHGSTTDSLDPATYENGFAQAMAFAIHNYLTEVKADGSLAGELAESFEASADAKTWTFKLRKAKFHNGKSVTAKDVIASIEHHRGEDSKSGGKAVADTIESMKADGDSAVIFTLKEGNADFPYMASDYHLAILPTDDSGKIDPVAGIGAGAYTLKSYEPGVKAEFEKFPDYWNENEGHVDTAEILTVADVAARTNALTTGEADVIDRLDIKTLHLLKRKPGVKIMETSGNAHYSMPMRCDTDPYKSNDVRMALKLSMDREALLQNVLRGHGYVGNDHPIGRANRYLAKDLEQRTYDPDKAKHHLKKAGAEGLKIQLSAADAAFAGAVDAAVLYKEQAAKAGINIEVVREPNDGYWSNVWMKKPYCMCYWGGRPTEDWMFVSAYAADSKWNDAFWQHERFNKVLVEARSELDEAKRAEMYAELQTIVRDEAGTAIPMFNNYVFASSDKVSQPEQMGNNWPLDGNRAIQRWWKTG
ncbi:MAG: ABC transporter substrate-binding protein [Thiolinea sp.]